MKKENPSVKKIKQYEFKFIANDKERIINFSAKNLRISTSIKDKNNTTIYDNDVLHYEYDFSFYFVIKVFGQRLDFRRYCPYSVVDNNFENDIDFKDWLHEFGFNMDSIFERELFLQSSEVIGGFSEIEKRKKISKELFLAIRKNDIQKAKLAIEKGASVNMSPDSHDVLGEGDFEGGLTQPIHLICESKYISLPFIQLLVNNGALINNKNPNQQDALELALNNKNSTKEIIDYLKKKYIYFEE